MVNPWLDSVLLTVCKPGRQVFSHQGHLTLNAPITTKVVCSGSTLFASILNSSVMLDNYLQQTTSAEDIFRFIFFFLAL